MHVLVTAASKHGATSGIAEAVAETLRGAGLAVDVLPPEDVSAIERYDAVILGSAVYAGRWVDSARAFVDRHAPALLTRPVWLFSSGPIGDPPKPVEEPPEVAANVERLAARGHRVFAGRLEREELGFLERTVTRALRAPDGDFRDWEAIRAWASEIATDLASVGAPAR
jgi:menaquinone-dependent protoporphyrinogen oxidase